MADPPPSDTIVADPPPFDTIVWEGRTWLVGRRLGAGKFAVVHEATCRELPSKRVAAKVINTAHLSKWAQAQLAIEIDVWKALDHRFIVKLYGSMAQGDFLVLFLELAEGGELFERLVERESFVEEEAARLMRQLLSALVYMHERGVIHRDLKPENLLLDSASDRASLRIADFGAAKQLTDLTGTLPSALASTPCGSLGYAAPEQLRQQLYERQCDLWSAGVVAYVLLSGCMPFDPSTYAGSSFALVFPEELFGGVTPAAVDFIRSLLQIDPLLRPTAAKAMAHPWLTSDAPMPTPLPTPQQLGILKRSGDMGGKFSHASDLWLYSCATTPAAQALEGARKCQRGGDGRAGGNMLLVLSEEPDVPILALPDMRAYRAPLRGGIISARAIESALVRRGCGMRLLGGGGMG